LVELDPEIAEVARRAVGEAGLDEGFSVVFGDAGDPVTFQDFGPADLLLLCGIFGNVSEADIRNTVRRAAEMTARGGTVIWTRHRREPNLVPTVRGWFAEAGFAPLWESDAGLAESVYVAGHRLEGETAAWTGGERLFTFVK
jgi:hypothetical protein